MIDKKLEEFKARMCPPSEPLSELQIEKAIERYLMKGIISLAEEIDFFHKVKVGKIGNKILTPSLGEARLNDCLRKMKEFKQSLKNLNSLEGVSELFTNSKLVKYHKIALTTTHAGDCNGLPCGCDRCEAESFFNIPYTTNWNINEGKLMVTALIEAGLWETVDIEDVMEEKNESE